jgi:hypothetical protein
VGRCASLVLAIGPAWAQSTQDVPVKPIGKVMVASGTATIERVNAHVVFASVEKVARSKRATMSISATL